MKRTSLLVSLCLIIGLLLSTGASFAEDLKLVDIYPKDKYHGLMPNNIAIKMRFSENMTSTEAIAANEKAFEITGKDGKKIPYTTLQNPKRYPNDIWLQINKNLKPEEVYHLTISSDLVSSAGNKLNQEIVSEFGVRNTSADTTGYGVLMVLMVVGMVGYTIWDTRRKAKKEAASKIGSGEEKVNPYKEARRTGKSVEKIIAEQEKLKARNAKKREAEEAAEAALAEKEARKQAEASRPGVKRVKQKRPIRAVGGVTPAAAIERRLARAEARRQAAERANAKRVRTKQPSRKGSKQRQRKKK
ncbi:MAG TPA: Ig-like domain-containing protein [Clostridiales bacterium]|jgi:predicted negative regulator of RcsB-dependent stress response|nr:Ig-like domain-containing protein [Clostridiales bacterium]